MTASLTQNAPTAAPADGWPLPPEDEMYRALAERDTGYEGVFVVAVRSTGIVCRPGCPARTPRRANVLFLPTLERALDQGFRPCKRCRPEERAGAPPAWITALLAEVGADPARRWRDHDLRAVGLDPVRVRRWFQAAHGTTFHGWLRARRLGLARAGLAAGDGVLDAGLAHGWDSVSAFHDAFVKRFGTTPARAREAGVMAMTRLLTPLGPLVVGAVDAGIAFCEFVDRRRFEPQLRLVEKRHGVVAVPGRHEHSTRLGAEVDDWFAGRRRTFDTPLALRGTPFQQDVWDALRRIPYGQRVSYAELAREVGRPEARRAVGKANGDNPLGVIVPCHRVVGSDGSLTGYGGGLWRKRALLAFEARHAD